MATVEVEATDIVTCTEVVENTLNWTEAITDTATITDTAESFRVFIETITESVTISETGGIDVVKLIQIIEQCLITDEAIGNLEAILSVAESFTVADIQSMGLSLSATDIVTVSETIKAVLEIHLNQVEKVTLSESPALSIQITQSIIDHVTVSDTANIQAILMLVASDKAVFSVTLGFDGDLYTGWVMDTTNFAVGRYDNYPFNSFAPIDGKYYGANSNGLYLLEGDDDDGEEINAFARFGLNDMGTNANKRIRRAYLGIRNDGSVILKIVDDDGEAHYRQMDKTNTRINREFVNVGRSINSVYFQFEVENVGGADFEVSDIMIIPILLNRRRNGH